jgi:hypothetical protein
LNILRTASFLFLIFFQSQSYAQSELTKDELINRIDDLEQQLIDQRLGLEDPILAIKIYLEQLEYIEQLEDNSIEKFRYLGNHILKFNHFKLRRETVNVGRQYFLGFDKIKDSLSRSSPESTSWWLRFHYETIALNYAALSILDSAGLVHKKILALPALEKVTHASAMNNYGLFLLYDLQEIDSALYYFTKASKLLNSKTEYLHGSIMDNIADVYLMMGQTGKARELYYQNFLLYKSGTLNLQRLDIKRFISAGCQFITTSIALNNLSKVDEVYNELQDYIENYQDPKPDMQDKLQFLRAEEKLLLFKGRAIQAASVSRNIRQLSDSLERVERLNKDKYLGTVNTFSLNQIRENYELRDQQKELKIASHRNTIIIVSLISLIIIGFLGFIFYIRRKRILIARKNRMLAEQNLEHSVIKNQQMANELENKKRDLSDFAINLSQNQEWAGELAKKIQGVKNGNEQVRETKLKELEEEITNKVKFDSNSKIFFNRLDKLSASFYECLKKHYPHLSKTDRRLCSLIRLKMDNNDIAGLQNICLSSLHTSRYRLRKKLNLAENEDLDAFIQDL